MTDGLRQHYEEVILDHNRRLRNYDRALPGTNRLTRGFNKGCAISTASVLLMTKCLIGRSEREAHALFRGMHALLASEGRPEVKLDKADRACGRARSSRARVSCATLAWYILHSVLGNEALTVTRERHAS